MNPIETGPGNKAMHTTQITVTKSQGALASSLNLNDCDAKIKLITTESATPERRRSSVTLPAPRANARRGPYSRHMMAKIMLQLAAII